MPDCTLLPQLDCSSRAKAVTLRPSGPAVSAASEKRQDFDADFHAAGGASLLPESGRFLSAATAAAQEEGEREGAESAEEEECFYYSFCPDDSHRFIALDSYDVNAIREELGPGELRAEKDGEEQEEGGAATGEFGDGRGPGGMEVLSRHNPNRNKNDAEGMDGLDKRYGSTSPPLRWGTPRHLAVPVVR